MAKRTTAKTTTAKTSTTKKTTARRRTKASATTPSSAKTVPESAATTSSGAATLAAKPAATAATGAPKPAEAAAKILGKRELIDRVVTASGIKKSAAKPVVEAMLRELGDAVSKGETLNLQPLGKGIVKNRKELENAEVIELRLRRSKQAIEAAKALKPDPLAKAAE
ncbi:MAG: HU family DNA-binding protein [Rhodobacter sp.]|nr:HU family DNA-binding protein [Rhodobacter sp.]